MKIIIWFICGLIGSAMILKTQCKEKEYGLPEIFFFLLCTLAGWTAILAGFVLIIIDYFENRKIKISFKNPFYKEKK